MMTILRILLLMRQAIEVEGFVCSTIHCHPSWNNSGAAREVQRGSRVAGASVFQPGTTTPKDTIKSNGKLTQPQPRHTRQQLRITAIDQLHCETGQLFYATNRETGRMKVVVTRPVEGKMNYKS